MAGRFRGDIEGLRAIAVGLVIAFHARIDGVAGGFVGVDVFYVISGFLITRMLLAELETTGTISVQAFYARRVRRLLPLSCLVLVATTVGAALWLPPIDRGSVSGDVRAAALLFANWEFARDATAYMADSGRNPVLHFWTLGVEEQFYVAWPLLLLGATSWSRCPRRAVVIVLIVVGGVSCAASLATTPGAYAFFGTHTRAWELAVGGGLAVAPLDRIPDRLARAVGWGGLALVIAAALLIDATTPFPGLAALVPVFGTVLLIANGTSTRGVGRWLANPISRYVGRISYGWYLWHWPCLVFVGAASRVAGDAAPIAERPPDPYATFIAIAGSFVLAVVSHHVLEDRVRTSAFLRAGRRRTLGLGVVLTLVSVLAGTSLRWLGSDGGHGTLAERARWDLPKEVSRCFVDFEAERPADGCVYGDPAARRSIALVGDSHALGWFPAVEAWARARGWRLVFWGKLACPVVDTPVWHREGNRPYTSCTRWRASVMSRLRSVPDLAAVILGRAHWYSSLLVEGSARAGEAHSARIWQPAIERTITELMTIAPHVVLLAPPPRPGRDVPACLSRSPDDPSRCSYTHDPTQWNDRHIAGAERAAVSGRAGVAIVDLTSTICATTPCQVLSPDGIVIYRDHHHLTATFARSIAESLGMELDAIVGRPSP